MPADAAADRFDSTERYYAAHRPGYGNRVLDYLASHFGLDADTRVLDLGCGAGQLAVPLAARTGDVVGVDPNAAMLDHASEFADTEGATNVEWLVGSDADLQGLAADIGTVRLATIGRAFHWMEQGRTLDHLHSLTDDCGSVAIVTDREWLTRGTRDWQAAIHDIATDSLDDVPERTGPVSHDDDPWDELVAEHGFADEETRTFVIRREWSVWTPSGTCSRCRSVRRRRSALTSRRSPLTSASDSPCTTNRSSRRRPSRSSPAARSAHT